jgi:hypothetical protein
VRPVSMEDPTHTSGRPLLQHAWGTTQMGQRTSQAHQRESLVVAETTIWRAASSLRAAVAKPSEGLARVRRGAVKSRSRNCRSRAGSASAAVIARPRYTVAIAAALAKRGFLGGTAMWLRSLQSRC